MADNTLVLCGGTGAHVALAYLRLHFLGAALGYFRRPDGNLATFPELFLVDQDAGDGGDAGSTAWQAVRFLIDHHPGRLDRAKRMGRNEAPSILEIRPLPVGRRNEWYRPPYDSLQGRFGSSPLLPALFAEKQRSIEYSKGMMGSPALGSLLFRLKEHDEREREVNNDEVFGELLRKQGRIVVAGSGVGGTGAAVTPTLARRLAEKPNNAVMAAILLSWFKFDEQVADPVLRERAAIKNRILQQNAHSALEFCGQSLAREVAALPIGMPEGALVLREFTGDFAQPICESFAHYVAALGAFRHFTSENPYGRGLYAMGATGRGRLDGATAIPGGTLQDLVNRAATLADLLGVWERVLASSQTERIVPSLYAAVAKVCDPMAAAKALEQERIRYKAQLDEVAAVLKLKPDIQAGLTLERRCHGLVEKGGLETGSDAGPVSVALALFNRAADLVLKEASEHNLLKVLAGHPETSHWPDLHSAGITIPVRQNGDLNTVPEGNIPVVIQAIVNRDYLCANGWPHPLAAAHFFKYAIRQSDRTARRQLEILLVGIASGALEVREIPAPAVEELVSLEAVVREYERREGFQGLGRLGVYWRGDRGEEQLIAFSAPHTLLAPVPFLDDAADNALWQRLWVRLSGATSGESWKVAPSPQRWSEERAVWMVRAWLARERSRHGEDGPAWSNLFEPAPAHPPVRFGFGKRVEVYWRDEERLIPLHLPDKDKLDWIPDASVPERDLGELERQVPELAAYGGYSKVQFEMPNVTGPVQGFWREHLDELLQAGRISAFGQLPNRQVAIGTLVGGVVRQTLFSGTLILGRAEIAVQKVTPLEQKPIFGGRGDTGPRRFPDLPLKAEYFGLAAAADRPLLALAKAGESFQDARPRPVESADSQGRPTVTWKVPLLGRRDPLTIQISLEGEPDSSAHWMVWPRFRSADPSRWRAYYLYDYCRNPNLVCDVLWLEGIAPGSSRLQLKERQAPFPRMEPLRYNSQQESRAHTGGPPLALCLRNHRNGEQRGLYLVGLEILQSAETRLDMAIDFGTSHSVVAIKQGEREKKVVALAAELDPGARNRALSLHLSEDREHLSEEGGLEEDGNWMPNYRRGSAEMVPSELLLYRSLDQAKGDDLAVWLPLQHYTIPPLDLARGDVGQQIVSGFKWDASSTHFQGREPQLREHYQSLLLELALAHVVANELRNIPTGHVGVTFCYPLRSPRDQIQALRGAIDVVLRRTARSTGINTVAYREIGILDESRAAAVRRELAGEVCMVADLGGGTLDVLISGYDAKRVQLDEVADSVRLGGNLLLREMIHAAASYMPKNSGWDQHPEAKLNAWIRGKGAASLWGPDAGSKPKFSELEVSGFERPAEGNLARQLINRYFSLIVDFLARNLAAYLVDVWYPRVKPADYPVLSLAVQLRGNGWKLRYQRETESERNQAVQGLVRRRLGELWQELPAGLQEFPLPENWLDSGGFASMGAKTAPAMGAVGVAMSQEEVRSNWHTCTLVEVEVLRDSGVEPVPWISRVPFDTGGLTGVQLTRVSPVVPIDPSGVERPVVIRGLDPELLGQVNRALQNDGRIDGHRFAAPISAEVWETLFRVPQFWPHLQGTQR